MLLLAVIASLLAMVSSQIGLCPAPTGDFPNPSSEQCTTFFRCIQGNPTLLRCPANQRFDFLFRICRQQALVDCNSQLQLFAAPAIVPGLGGLGSLGIGGSIPTVGGGGGGIGAGLPNGGLINLLTQLDGDGQNGSNGLATLLMVSALMNQRNGGPQQANPVPRVGQVPAGGGASYYGQVPVGPVVLPLEQTNRQQTVGNFGPVRTGFRQGTTGLSPPAGGTFVVLPQVPQGQANQFQGQQGRFQGQGNGLAWSRPGLVGQGQVGVRGQALTPAVSPGWTLGQGQTIGQGQVITPLPAQNPGLGLYPAQGQGQTVALQGQAQSGQVGQAQLQNLAKLSRRSGTDANAQDNTNAQ